VITVDPDAIRAYQKKDIPLERFPKSDFEYHALCSLDNLICPSLNWKSKGMRIRWSGC
jgi:hypothetical protein